MCDRIKSVRDLEVYNLAFDCAMKIFEITKNFPPEERYSLTDQIRAFSQFVRMSGLNISTNFQGWLN